MLAVRLGLSAKDAVCSVDGPYCVAALRHKHPYNILLDPLDRVIWTQRHASSELVELGIDGLVDVAGDRILTRFAFRHMVLPNSQVCSVHEGRW